MDCNLYSTILYTWEDQHTTVTYWPIWLKALNKPMRRKLSDLSSHLGPAAGPSEHGNEPSGGFVLKDSEAAGELCKRQCLKELLQSRNTSTGN
jgi:hypothetical protein